MKQIQKETKIKKEEEPKTYCLPCSCCCLFALKLLSWVGLLVLGGVVDKVGWGCLLL